MTRKSSTTVVIPLKSRPPVYRNAARKCRPATFRVLRKLKARWYARECYENDAMGTVYFATARLIAGTKSVSPADEKRRNSLRLMYI